MESIRWDKVNQAIQAVKLTSSGKNVNERYPEAIESIENNSYLNTSEKDIAKRFFTREKDRENLLFLKGPKYSCEKCNRKGFTLGYCEHCLRDCLKSQFDNWTSGNNIIDEAIQNSQMKLPLPLQIIEWIPFHELQDTQYYTEGGYCTIHTATWTKGYIKSFDKENQKFERSGPWKCILKKLLESNNAQDKFLEEIKLHISLRAKAYKLVGCRGVSRDPNTGDYILVLDPMLHDLQHFIHDDNKNTPTTFTWNKMYTLCFDIVNALTQIHKEGLVHKDLHSANILQRPDSVWVIADLGLCGPPNETSGYLYGRIAYIAPEVLFSLSSANPHPYTSTSDIYSVGMLIYEAVTGQVPFTNIYNNPKELAMDVCAGTRPNIPDGLPDHLEKIIRQCWKANTEERPTAAQLYDYFYEQVKSSTDQDIPLPRSNTLLPLPNSDGFINKSQSYRFDNLPVPKDIPEDQTETDSMSNNEKRFSETNSISDNEKRFSESTNVTSETIASVPVKPESMPFTKIRIPRFPPYLRFSGCKKILKSLGCCVSPG